jgi:peptidoglycan hydrolase CwlO-like protein
MWFKTAIKSVMQELIIPVLDKLKADVSEIKSVQLVTNKRIDDISIHLADLSRRLDETNTRIDETNTRIDETNNRINRLYEVIVRREEHTSLEQRLVVIEKDVQELKSKIGT